jgi:predicted patatin/cPLA2 family phospholipase
LKIKTKVCHALQANGGHNAVFTSGVLSRFIGRESINGFGAIRVGILA